MPHFFCSFYNILGISRPKMQPLISSKYFSKIGQDRVENFQPSKIEKHLLLFGHIQTKNKDAKSEVT